MHAESVSIQLSEKTQSWEYIQTSDMNSKM